MKTNNTSMPLIAEQSGWDKLVAAFTLTLVLSAMLVLAACSSDQEAHETAPYPSPNPLLYEVTNAAGEVEGWLLGTIHALPEEAAWRTSEIDQVVDEADLLLVEVASLGQNDAVRQAFVELSQSPGLSPLTDRVSPELRADLNAMIDELNTSPAILRSWEDWAAAIMLAQVDAPGDPEYGVDRALIAQFQGSKVAGFETAREQLGIFDQLAAEDQRALLEGTIEDWASSRGERDRLLRAWIAGDAQVLEVATNEGIMADPDLRAALLENRNRDWIEQLLPILADQPKPLVAVGAAHLVGPDGLVAMLEAQGFTLTRLSAS